ncbi:tRNA ligase 1 isoform X2 [Cynara cardunculus var. scolymus]|uniref:tRNA ligase 1 isoform X2 n=1 Tax=Cynara cardunculus var. scolymus TaxID=59895 RepID=UPI000D6312A6|nr:tRNA ligase 1 isoform X2 [Cynara cardunculus var. scolymus]
MSASSRAFTSTRTLSSSPLFSPSITSSKSFTFFRLHFRQFIHRHSFIVISNISNFSSIMPHNQKRGGRTEQRWIQKPGSDKMDGPSDVPEVKSAASAESITNGINRLGIAENNAQPPVPVPQFGSISVDEIAPLHGQSNGQSHVSVGCSLVKNANLHGKQQENAAQTAALSKLFRQNLLENFTVDNFTYSTAKIRATFYPKFENEKSDQEVRIRMIELVSKGLATLEVSLKHSGSLFMYAGHEGGAYAKNSFGNVYTAVGVFVLGRIFLESWGTEASKKQAEFNAFLEREHMSISMELVTAVLGDHGQRPREDYVVVTAVTELGYGKPKFYSTPEIIAFCRKWRLPTNHIWLFLTRNSVTSFFAAYDALCEEGTATSVCKALDEVADISVPGSKDHIKVQGEILEGLVARLVSHESSKQMELVLKAYPSPIGEVHQDLGPGLREICAANRSDEKQQIKALLQNVGTSFCPDYVDWFGIEAADVHPRNADRSVVSKFLQANPCDNSTIKLKEMVRLMREKRFPAAFKCYHNFHKINTISGDNLHYKMVIHVHSDSGFRRYQKEMRYKPDLWPLYRGFFVDINLFKASKEKAEEIARISADIGKNDKDSDDPSRQSGLADEDANLMIKLKFLTYKLRTFLIRNGLSVLFKEGPAAYRTYYLRQMKIWNTSPGKQRQLSKMLDEWAVYIKRKCGHRQLSSSVYLSEAEPFLEQYAKRSPENQALIGCAGDLVRTEDFLAIVEGGRDEEGDLETEKDLTPSSPSPDAVQKKEGLIVFFPGIPGCAKSALCKEILSASGGLEDDRPIHSLMGDLIKGRYWQKIADERRRKPYSIVLADKNAPNEEVWRQIEDMCRSTKASAVPIVPDSEGTETNPFSLDALAVFIYRVLNRVNHPGNLDKSSPNAGYVLLMFYHLYDGKSRREFESELIERFGSLVKMPLLKSERSPVPDKVKTVLEEGINLYWLHSKRHGRLDSTKGTYVREWVTWEKQLRETLFGNAEYLTSIQVPFEFAVNQVLEQLKRITKGEYTTPTSEKRKFGTIVFAAIDVPVADILNLLSNISKNEPKVKAFLEDTNMANNLKTAHITLAHKRSHGVTAVANYGPFVNQTVPVDVAALFLSDKLAALETHPGSVDGQKISSKNQWPHLTLWTAEGIPPKEANTLPDLLLQGKANRIEIKPPFRISGVLQFH